MKRTILSIILSCTLACMSFAQNTVLPMLNTHWGQRAPYNSLCPVDSSGKRALAGCGPIAMAQIIYYLGLRNDSLQLIRDCGNSAFTRYGAEASSTKPSWLVNALKKQFGLNHYISILDKRDFNGEDGQKEWNRIILTEILNRRPVIYSGSNGKTGHFIILDGMVGKMVHANFGWKGKKDGFYPLDNILGYNQNVQVIIGIDKSNYIPQQYIIRLNTAGTLQAIMKMKKVSKALHIKVIGKINKDDINWLRELSSLNKEEKRRGLLQTIDLSETDMTYLPDSAFAKSISLTNIILPKNLNTIGQYAFGGCTNLNHIDIPTSVRKIRWRAFIWCKNLLDIHIPEGVKNLMSQSFYHCENLTDVKLPSSIDSIGRSVFENCNRLEKLEIPAATSFIGGDLVKYCRLANIDIDKNNSKYYSDGKQIFLKKNNESIEKAAFMTQKEKEEMEKKKALEKKLRPDFENGAVYKNTYKIVNGKKTLIKRVRIK